jgi:VanZ family protein
VSRASLSLPIILYASLMAYASTIVGPVGPHYVPIDWNEAFQQLINMPYVEHDSGQRSDWMGNLVMTVPLGFMVAGLFSSGRLLAKRNLSVPGVFCAALLCFAIIVAVKYAQLFFPPRTVTLNYLIAQCAGATVGIMLLGVIRSAFASPGINPGGLETLRVVLCIYSGLLIAFLLMPLDFALNAEDLTRQLNKVPITFSDLGGQGRPILVRLALILTVPLQTAPLGALLTLLNRGRVHVGRSVAGSTWIGFLAMLSVYAATTLVMSGSASLPAVFFHTTGIAFGAWLMHWLTRRNPDQLHNDLGGIVPWVVPFYLLIVCAANGLLSLDWTTPDAAADDFYGLGLLPLFNYYIVSKAQAAKNIVGHAALYAPIGVMVGLRARDASGRATAFVLAAILSAGVEIGRFLRPGLTPDINAVPLAGIAAWAGAALTPLLLDMLASVAAGGAGLGESWLSRPSGGDPPKIWGEHEPDLRTSRRELNKVIGDIEEY